MFLSLDTETGGIGLDKSLLTLGLVIADDDFNVVDTYHWGLIPNDGVYRVDPNGLAVNKIDLVELAKEAFTYREASQLLYAVISEHSNNGKEKIVPVGKNVGGDISQICDKLMKRGTWENFVSYRFLDVSSIYQLYRLKGLIPDTGGSLESICEHYGYPTDGLHGALKDAELTLKCLQRMASEIGE